MKSPKSYDVGDEDHSLWHVKKLDFKDIYLPALEGPPTPLAHLMDILQPTHIALNNPKIQGLLWHEDIMV